MRLKKGFTLLELMIVVAIIGILAAAAIPAYQDYLARGQISEGVTLASAGKTPLAEYFLDKGVWPSSADLVMGALSGKYVSMITITQGNNQAISLSLEARMKSTGINAEITGGTLILETAAGRNWQCTGGTVSAKFRPAACR